MAIGQMAKKTLKGAKSVGKALTKPNIASQGGGLSAYLVPRRANVAGAAVVVGGIGAFNLGKEGIKGRNRAVMGKVTYMGGPARMTQNYTSGVVGAMKNASGGNYEVFSDMAEEVVRGRGLGDGLETYGATPELVSALYHMGGR